MKLFKWWKSGIQLKKRGFKKQKKFSTDSAFRCIRKTCNIEIPDYRRVIQSAIKTGPLTLLSKNRFRDLFYENSRENLTV